MMRHRSEGRQWHAGDKKAIDGMAGGGERGEEERCIIGTTTPVPPP